MDYDEAETVCQRILDAVGEAVIADDRFLESVLTGVLAQGHVLLEDVPGTGKTLTARLFASALNLCSPGSSSRRTCSPLTSLGRTSMSFTYQTERTARDEPTETGSAIHWLVSKSASDNYFVALHRQDRPAVR